MLVIGSIRRDFQDGKMLMIVIIQLSVMHHRDVLIRWRVHSRDRMIAAFDEVWMKLTIKL